MCEELKLEIENSKNLPRVERRKEERKLQKKYNDKSIRIIGNKSFKKSKEFNRETRRQLIKDKNLVKEIVRIIRKYFPLLDDIISNLTDKRNQSYITYNMKSIIYTKLFALLCGITTMTDISDENNFDSKETIDFISQLSNQRLTEIPYWQTIQDVIEQLDIEEIRNIRKYMVRALIRSKMFYKYRHNEYWQLLVDATGISSHNYNLNGTCIYKKSKNGVMKYYKYALEAKIVVGNIVISLDTEWIENIEINNEKQKQDCEINAFKRMAPRIYKEYPKMKLIITGDALYATEPTIDICNKYKWKYIFNLKKDRLKQIYNDFEDDLSYENETNKENYFLSTKINYKNHNINALRYQEYQKDKKTKENKLIKFNYITNLKVNNHNIEKIVKLGRKRWKIENEGFNVQKNGIFHISHLCSRNENAIKIHYYLIQIAHIIRQLLEYGSILLSSMKLKTKKEVSNTIFKTLTSSYTNLNNIETKFQLRFDT